MRVCLIGDSHLAALKHGWQAGAGDTPVEPIFFAGHGKSMRRLTISGDVLVAPDPFLERTLKITSGGQSQIHGHYDCYVVHGLELGIGLALNACMTSFAPNEHSDRIAWLAHPSFAGTLRTTFRESRSVHVMSLLRRISKAPILFSPMPMSAKQNRGFRERLSRKKSAGILLDVYSNALHDIGNDLNARFLPQPVETLCDDRMGTKENYSEDAARFSARAQQDDNGHMNAAYGAAVVRDILVAIGQPMAQQSVRTLLPTNRD